MHPSDQIYGFSFVGRLNLARETVCNKFIELAIANGYALSPNLVVALDGSVLCPLSMPPNRHNPSITVSVQEANSISQQELSFSSCEAANHVHHRKDSRCSRF